MEFEKKLKTRLNIAIVYIVLGLVMILGSFILKTSNDFISSFGFAIIVMGIARVRNYFMITKTKETIRKREIAETDERNISIILKAKNVAFSIYLLLQCLAVIVLTFMDKSEIAKWIAISVGLLVALYWGCYLVYRKIS